MHYPLYVIVKNDTFGVKTSGEARQLVAEYLTNSGFVENDGEFDGGICDWFVIGGRWSGELTIETFTDEQKEIYEKLVKDFGEKYGWSTGGEERVTEETRRKQWMEMQEEVFPEIETPLRWRNTYDELGQEDDAMFITREVWNKVIAPKEKMWGSLDGGGVYALQGGYIGEHLIDNAWVVIIDYHI